MLNQVIKSNNNWLWSASNFSDLDLFEGISSNIREKIYNAAKVIKNTLLETGFEALPENFEEPLIGRLYQAVRGYANRYSTLDNPLMPSTVEAMFIVTKVLYRTEYLKVA